uniref:Uncharacterized protein n=1 Tax=Setaria viridis TaxID=4556 RepID=A0A4U6UN26_SETVI|nr:hypothetical protein SEVIR_5G014400v2 [Setaria viridis]
MAAATATPAALDPSLARALGSAVGARPAANKRTDKLRRRAMLLLLGSGEGGQRNSGHREAQPRLQRTAGKKYSNVTGASAFLAGHSEPELSPWHWHTAATVSESSLYLTNIVRNRNEEDSDANALMPPAADSPLPALTAPPARRPASLSPNGTRPPPPVSAGHPREKKTTGGGKCATATTRISSLYCWYGRARRLGIGTEARREQIAGRRIGNARAVRRPAAAFVPCHHDHKTSNQKKQSTKRIANYSELDSR